MHRTVARIEAVFKKIADGEMVLSDPGEHAVRALYDSGSSIDAADHVRHFPGAQLIHDDEPGATFASATGAPLTNDGNFDVPFRSYNGHKKETEFLNAPVAMPIVSVRRWDQNGHRSIVDEDSGVIIHKAAGEEYPDLGRSGAYFMNMLVRRNLLEPNRVQDFKRRGTV